MVKYFIIICYIFSSIASATSQIHDPTAPSYQFNNSNKKSATKKTNQLTAIFYKQNKRQAIINNKLYSIGDYFSGTKIISIQANHIILKNSQGTKKLTLIQSFKKLKKY